VIDSGKKLVILIQVCDLGMNAEIAQIALGIKAFQLFAPLMNLPWLKDGSGRKGLKRGGTCPVIHGPGKFARNQMT
jgi:hypothetical protein